MGACARDFLDANGEEDLLACPACVDEKYFQMQEREARDARDAAAPSEDAQMAEAEEQNINIRRCPFPGCSMVVERTSGCAHMQCPSDPRHHFCILCGFRSDDGQIIYRHMNEHIDNHDFTEAEVWGGWG